MVFLIEFTSRVQPKDVFNALSSITTVIGVAMFAQWSLLSTITSGIILSFFPLKIRDAISLIDKNFDNKELRTNSLS